MEFLIGLRANARKARKYGGSKRLRYDANHTALLCTFNGKLYFTFNQSEQGVVFTHTNAFAWVELSTALTHDDVARNNVFAAVNFHAQTF